MRAYCDPLYWKRRENRKGPSPMARYLKVDKDLHARQGLKFVLTPEGQALELLPGELPGPGADVVSHVGEPRFHVRMTDPVRTDAEVPDAVGLALRRVADRLQHDTPDGSEDANGDGIVEWVYGPAVHDGALLMALDTDGFGFNPAMIEAMTRIFADELEPIAVSLELSAASNIPTEILPAWRSSAEREER